MKINHNVSSLNTYRQLSGNTNAVSKSLEKLSSGFRINRAGDDAAGLAISEKMRGQIRGLDMAAKNAQDGISMIQTAEGALSETHSILQRMRELAVQAGNDTNTAADREEIQKEINQLTSEINRIGNTTEFNTQKLLNGGGAGKAEVSALTGGADPITAKGAVYTVDLTGSGTLTNGTTIKFSLIDDEGNTVTYSATVDNSASSSDGDTIGIQGVSDQAGTAAAIADSINAWLSSVGENTRWLAEVNSDNDVTITWQATDDGGNNLISNFDDGSDANVADAIGYVAGTNGSSATNATGKISFTNNLLSSGTSIVIDTETFILYDSSKGEIATTAPNSHAIDIANMKSNEEIIDAIIAANAAGGSTDVTLTKLSQNELGITATSAGAAGNSIAVSVSGPAGQTNSFSADFQIGANKGQSMSIEIGDMRSLALGISSLAGTSNKVTIDGVEYEVAWASSKAVTNGTNNVTVEYALSVASHADAAKAVEVLDAAISKVSAERSKLGAYQNRLEHTINNLGTSSENLTAAESRIRDVDMAKEIMEYTKNNILTQAATAMLAQANQLPQSVLQLLQ